VAKWHILYYRYDIPKALRLKAAFQLRVFHTCVHARKSWIRLQFHISANNLNKLACVAALRESRACTKPHALPFPPT
jgi:hypothetical protein